MHALRVQDRPFVTQAGRQGHEKGLTFIRVRAWLALALHVHDRLFMTQAETRKRFDIYKSVGYIKYLKSIIGVKKDYVYTVGIRSCL